LRRDDTWRFALAAAGMQTASKHSVAIMSARIVTGLFHDATATCTAVDALLSKGFVADEIGVLMTDATRSNAFTIADAKTIENEGCPLTGSVAGATVADIVSTASLVVPGRAFLVAGPMVSVLADAADGVEAATLVGALAGLGFSENEARFVERELEQGGILIGVRTTPRNAMLAKKILRRHGGNALKAA
jgi:hypothetical protein